MGRGLLNFGLALAKDTHTHTHTHRAELVNWREELQTSTLVLDMGKKVEDMQRLPDDELFTNPVGRTLPYAPLPTIDTPFGLSIIYVYMYVCPLFVFVRVCVSACARSVVYLSITPSVSF